MSLVASISVNTPDNIQFVNVDGGPTKDSPTLSVTSGDWETADHVESGIVFDVYGDQTPMLTPQDARKLAKWLVRAADALDGLSADKKKKHRHNHYEEEDDENDLNKY